MTPYITKVVICSTVSQYGGAHNPEDDKHGKKCASSKFHVGVSSGCNPPEGGEEPKEPSDAEGTIPNSEQKESISEDVCDVAQVSPEGNPLKKARNALDL